MMIVATLLLLAGMAMLLIAAWGVLILPDALARQHAATKAGTVALSLLGAGIAVIAPADWLWRLALIIGFLLATLPLASHLLARAAVEENSSRDSAA